MSEEYGMEMDSELDRGLDGEEEKADIIRWFQDQEKKEYPSKVQCR